MIGPILTPLDGSMLAERVLPLAERLASLAGDRLILFQAQPEVAFIPRAEQALDTVARGLRARGLSVDVSVRQGDAVELILEEVRTRRAGLVVLCSHGRSGLDRWLCGTVAEKVICGAEVPVLLVPAAMHEITWAGDGALHVLVPLDGSPVAEEALQPALTFAASSGGQIMLVRVVESFTPPAWLERFSAEAEDELEIQRSAAAEYLASVVGSLRQLDRTVPLDTEVVVGRPAEAVARLAHAHHATLVAMTTHGAGTAPPTYIGRVATGMLQRSRVPLLFVRPARMREATGPAGRRGVPTAHLPDVPLATITLSARELELVQRGLQRLLGEVSPAESAYGLLARLRQAAKQLASTEASPK